jgi:hypothetical protein
MAGLTQWQERANEVSRKDHTGHRTRLSMREAHQRLCHKFTCVFTLETHRKRLVRVHHISKDAHDDGEESESEHGEPNQGDKPKDLSVGCP